MKESITKETINPKKAAELLLTRQDLQRPLRSNYVEELAKDMRDGTFILSQDALVIKKGNLINGQHRLSAVVKCGLPMPFYVMVTENEYLYKIMDSGRRRSIADALHNEAVMNGNNLTAIGKWILAYQHNLLGWSSNWISKLTRDQIISFILDNNCRLQEFLNLVRGMWGRDSGGAPILNYNIGAAFMFLTQQNFSEAEAFLVAVYDPSIGEIKAARLLYGRLFSEMRGRSRLPKSSEFGLLIKAYNGFIQGDQIKTLKMDPVGFPKIILK